MAFAMLMSAAVIAAAPVKYHSQWITPDDYPVGAYKENRGGITEFRLTASPEGEPIACEIERSSHYVDLDKKTCALLMRRARFEPARDPSGAAVHGVFRNFLRWWTGDDARATPLRYDISATLNRMPAGVDAPAAVTAAFFVAVDGTPSDCTAYQFTDDEKQRRVIALLGKVACDQILARWKPQPAKSTNGSTVASVQTATVLFNSQP